MSFTESLAEIVSENRNCLLAIHDTWQRIRLAQVAEILNGFAFASSKFNANTGTPLLRIRDILRGETDTLYDGDYDAIYLVKPGDLVVGMDGDFNSSLWRGRDALLNQRCCKIIPDERFYCRRLLAFALPGYLAAINAATSSVTVKHLSSFTIADIPLPLPPLPEQHRIVEEIEKQFSRLDDGVANLQRVKANLKRYRASVLQAACEGRLVPTESDLAKLEGREYEPADELLKRILVERRRKWEENELAKMRAKGKEPADDKWKARYKEPAAPNLSGLPELPEGWCWASLAELSWDSGYGTSTKCDYDADGPPVLRIPNIADGKVRFVDLKRAKTVISLLDQDWLSPGDLLVIRTNGSKNLIGRGALVEDDLGRRVSYASYLIRFRILLIGSLPRFVATIWHSNGFRSWIEARAATSAGQHNISMSTLSQLPIPIPPVAEQHRIVAEVERRLSIIDQMETAVEANLKRAQRLRQAILKKAFEGKLVPQDPNDEPAGVLLARIRAERNVPRKTGKRTGVGTS